MRISKYNTRYYKMSTPHTRGTYSTPALYNTPNKYINACAHINSRMCLLFLVAFYTPGLLQHATYMFDFTAATRRSRSCGVPGTNRVITWRRKHPLDTLFRDAAMLRKGGDLKLEAGGRSVIPPKKRKAARFISCGASSSFRLRHHRPTWGNQRHN